MTLYVNLFAGPGAGKSTTAAAVFARLKGAGVNAELVQEYAKECAWEGRMGPLRCQPYVFGEQLWRLERLQGRVDVVVTDSPILLSAVYASEDTPASFVAAVQDYHGRMTRMDVKLVRKKSYDPRGRFQNEGEARALDAKVHDLVGRWDLVVPGTEAGAARLTDAILARRA